MKELLGGDDADSEDARSPKKRKMKEAKVVKRSASSASMKMVKDAAKTIKKSVSAKLLNARQAVSSRRGEVVSKKTAKGGVLKRYRQSQTKLSSRNSSLTIVVGDSSPESSKGKRTGRPRKSIAKNVVRRMEGGGRSGLGTREMSSEGTIRVISFAGDE